MKRKEERDNCKEGGRREGSEKGTGEGERGKRTPSVHRQGGREGGREGERGKRRSENKYDPFRAQVGREGVRGKDGRSFWSEG